MNASTSGTGSPTVSVVIATWNTREMVCDALGALQRSERTEPLELIVVDNGSVDGTAEAIAARFPDVVCIRNARNTGYAHANNQGIRSAEGRFVFLLGSDTVVRPDTVSVMTRFLESHPEAAAVACRLTNPDGSPQMSCRRFPRLRDAVATYLSLHMLARRYTMHGFDFHKTQEVEQPAATALLIRRTVLEALQGFDERYTILYNDVDLCRRMRDAGGRIFFTGETELLHYGSSTTSTAPPAVKLEMYRNILQYFQRHHGVAAVWILAPILMVRLFLVTRSTIAFRLLRSRAQGGRS